MSRWTEVFVWAAFGALLLGGCSANKSATSNTGAATTSAPVAAMTVTGAAKVAAAGDAARGKVVYMQNCSSCHGATAGGGAGPSLKNEKARKNMAAAVSWIKNPQPPMPKLYPSPLSEKDVRDVAAYVETL
jgi:mono/diheme cytochrome c family protein